MQNITQAIKSAINQEVLWSVNEFFYVIQEFRDLNVEVSFWENEENWALLIFDRMTIGYLWKKYPVLFIQRDYFNKVEVLKENHEYISIVVVDDLNAEVLKLDYADLRDFLEYGINYDCFSVMDLWFQTNSI